MSADQEARNPHKSNGIAHEGGQELPRLSDAVVGRWTRGEEACPEGLIIPEYVKPHNRDAISVGTLMIGPGHFGRGLIGALHHQALLGGGSKLWYLQYQCAGKWNGSKRSEWALYPQSETAWGEYI